MDENESGRERGILSPDDRAFLRGEKEYKHPQSATNTRARIRTRIREGIKDLDIVLRYMDPEDIQTALELRAPDLDEYTEDLMTQRGLQSAIGVVYLACLERERTHSGRDDPAGWKYDEAAAKGIEVAINRLGSTVKDVTNSHEIEHGEPFDDLEGLDAAELGELSTDQLVNAWQRGTITEAQFERAMGRKYGARDDEE